MPGLYLKKPKRSVHFTHSALNLNRPKMAKDCSYQSLKLTDLPKDILFLVLSRLSLHDLMTLRKVSRYFCDLVDNTSSLWNACSLDEVWPNFSNIHYIQKAASHGNLAALIKMGIAFLYSDGIYGDDRDSMGWREDDTVEDFIRAEMISRADYPFTWIFYRPPWTMFGTCAKSRIFDALVEKATKNECDKSVYFCIGRTLLFFENDSKKNEAFTWFRKASENGCANSAYFLWLQKYKNVCCMFDPTCTTDVLLESIRILRDIVSLNPKCLEGHLALCLYYAHGIYGGFPRSAAASFVNQFFQSSSPTNIHLTVATNKNIPCQVRQILLDWIIEVIGMKSFSEEILHLTVRTIDRCLRANHIPKTQLQLLGITSLLLCARFLGKDILTIREAAWITDNTYEYEEVVYMMGQIMSMLRGNILVITMLDYLHILLELNPVSETIKWMTHYLMAFSLLHSELGQFPQSVVASSCYVLANIALQNRNFWPKKMVEFTGYDITHLTPCLILLHHETLHLEDIVDLRFKTLEAIKQRYLGRKFGSVSEMKLPSMNDFEEYLGIKPYYYQHVILTYTENITYNAQEQNLQGELDKSVCSGYEGDDEEDLLACKRLTMNESNGNKDMTLVDVNEANFSENMEEENEAISTANRDRLNETEITEELVETTNPEIVVTSNSDSIKDSCSQDQDSIEHCSTESGFPCNSLVGLLKLIREKIDPINPNCAIIKSPLAKKQILEDISNKYLLTNDSLKNKPMDKESNFSNDSAKS